MKAKKRVHKISQADYQRLIEDQIRGEILQKGKDLAPARTFGHFLLLGYQQTLLIRNA